MSTAAPTATCWTAARATTPSRAARARCRHVRGRSARRSGSIWAAVRDRLGQRPSARARDDRRLAFRRHAGRRRRPQPPCRHGRQRPAERLRRRRPPRRGRGKDRLDGGPALISASEEKRPFAALEAAVRAEPNCGGFPVSGPDSREPTLAGMPRFLVESYVAVIARGVRRRAASARGATAERSARASATSHTTYLPGRRDGPAPLRRALAAGARARRPTGRAAVRANRGGGRALDRQTRGEHEMRRRRRTHPGHSGLAASTVRSLASRAPRASSARPRHGSRRRPARASRRSGAGASRARVTASSAATRTGSRLTRRATSTSPIPTTTGSRCSRPRARSRKAFAFARGRERAGRRLEPGRIGLGHGASSG